MPLTSRATVVFPVPGFPVKTRCRVMVGAFRPASSRSFSTRSTATCRCTSRFTRCSPIRASSSASSSSMLRSGSSGSGRFGLCGRLLGWDGGTGAGIGIGEPVRGHGRGHGRQLGSGRDGGVPDDAHRRLAQLAGSRGDLRQCTGVVGRMRGALCRERAQDRGGGVAPTTPATRCVEEVLRGGRSTGGVRPVRCCPGRGLGHGRGQGQPFGAGTLRVHPGGRRQG